MKKRLRYILAALIVAAALTALAGSGLLRNADYALSDALYQTPSAVDGRIVIIGMDQKTLERYGPFQEWCRENIARTIEILNVSEDVRPAVIGVDVFFGGRADPGTDAALVEAAGRYGNVITASAGSFDSGFVETSEGFTSDSFHLTAFEEPFSALREATGRGHINAMPDKDGVLRHHLLYLDLPDGTRVPSLSLAVASRVCEVETPPVNDRGFWYVPFYKKPGFYELVSMADVLDKPEKADYYSGKVILIGPTAAGLQDSYFTSIDHAKQMYGVEYQANAIDALREGNYKREADEKFQLAALFLLLLAAFALFRRRKVPAATAAWLLLAGGWVGLCKGLYEAGWVLHALYVPLGVTIMYVGCIAVNYIEAALERQRVTGTFNRYVAPQIVKQLLETGADLDSGIKCDVAVLFVDVRGFTSMSERMEPERVVKILNDYLSLTTQCVMDNYGTLDKFVGDCTMAFWNAPLPQEDYVMLACRAAMAMVEGGKPLAERLKETYECDISFGIGVNVGPAVVGNIGSSKRMDYTAIGDTVNTASRLESIAPANTVYISRAVADRLKGRIKATPLENPPRLKGKAEGFEILTLDEIIG